MFLRENDGHFIMEDDIDPSTIAHLVTVLLPLLNIVMTFLEVDDGPTLATLISTLQELVPLTLIDAPQMLAHTIIKSMLWEWIKLHSSPRQGS